MIPPHRSPLPGTAALCLLLTLAAGAETLERGDSSPEEDRPPVPGKTRRLDQSSGSALQEWGYEERYGDEFAARRAIERALGFLAAQQAEEPDGSFPTTGLRSRLSAPVAVTALGALAYLSGGNGIDRGPHGRSLTKAIDYLLTHVDRESTSQQRGYISDGRDGVSHMHGHGFATLALAEAFAVSMETTRGARMREALELAVGCTERSQGLEGGWYYYPVRGILHEGSVTIALVQALRAAKGAGIRVDGEVIAKAVDYVKRSQREDGAFRYAIGSDQVTVALTAAAISTLNATGTYHGPAIAQGYDYIQRELRAREEPPEKPDPLDIAQMEHPYYERLYLAQALWHHADRNVFSEWAREERKKVLREQRRDGSWGDSRYGDSYATAVNVLFLALPDQLLPIFQR